MFDYSDYLKGKWDWDPKKNIPKLESGKGLEGAIYKVSANGERELDGRTKWSKGEMVVFSHGKWKLFLNQHVCETCGGSGFVSIKED